MDGTTGAALQYGSLREKARDTITRPRSAGQVRKGRLVLRATTGIIGAVSYQPKAAMKFLRTAKAGKLRETC
jgi:hypothetical protein